MAASPRSIRDATEALHAHFAAPKIPPSLPAERRRMLQAFIDEYDDSVDEDDARRVSQELKHFWQKYVSGSPQKLGAFVGVLRELRPAIAEEDDILEWYETVVKPIVTAVDAKKTALDDAHEFLAGVMIYDESADNAQERARTSARICADLLGVYLARTRGITQESQLVAPENAQIAKQVETALISFGRKMPRPLFHRIDDLIARAATRLQGLTLLSSFLQVQAPHLYLAMHTPLIDDLLRCLMNDTSTTVLSVALTSLIMLLPHLPASLNSRLPRLFLIYSRLLCWEKFSPLSTTAQKKLVTDDRISDDEYDHGDIGVDSKWDKCIPTDGMLQPAAPELMTYFTYLYGLYPLNFMSYIRKPRKYLKLLNFPGADDFDLDQAVIRSRSDQFRQAHTLHPNFYKMTPEEELIDPKWPKLDPSDVVAECHGLVVTAKPSILSPGPPPTGKLPEIPPLLPPIPSSNNGSVSPAISQMSLRSAHSWRDTSSTAVSADPESPLLGPNDEPGGEEAPRLRSGASQATAKGSRLLDEFSLPGSGFHREKKEPLTNLEYLQQKLTGLQNDLNFERWHKAQYSQHISQLMRKSVKNATVEAETLNLINANRALKKELEQARGARESTIKDSNLTRKQANNLETNMQERFNKMKKEQEVWVNDAEELKRLRAEMKHHRDLLSAAEARESNKKHELEIMQRDVVQMHRLQSQLQEAQRKVREYELREFDHDHAKRELGIVQSEKDTLHLRLQRHEQERERTKRVYSDRIAELEARMGSGGPYDGPSTSPSNETQALRQALADAQSKLAQLKKTHSRLWEKHTDLELEYQSINRQLEGLQGSAYGTEGLARNGSVLRNSTTTSGGLSVNRGGVLESVYGIDSDYGASSEVGTYSHISTSDPTPRRYDSTRDANPVSPASPQRNEAVLHNSAGLTWKPASSAHSVKTSESGAGSGVLGYNTTAPLRADEGSVASGSSGARREREKIAANSEVRVYGRGGAQNIKMKPKEKEKDRDKEGSSKAEKQKGGGFKAWKGIAGL